MWAGKPATALAHVERADLPFSDAMGGMGSLALRARAVADLADAARQHGREPPPMPPEVDAEVRGLSTRAHPRGPRDRRDGLGRTVTAPWRAFGGPGAPMAGPLIMISRSTVRPGQRATYEAHLREAIDMVHAEEPNMLGFHNYASEDGTEVVTVQIHSGPDSLDTHLKLFNERLSECAYAAVDTHQIDIYGAPNRDTREYVEALPERMPRLGVRVLPADAGGFLRRHDE